MTARLLAAFAALDLGVLLARCLRRRPDYATFTPIMRQWPVDCTVHGLQYASHLEPGCGCTPTEGA